MSLSIEERNEIARRLHDEPIQVLVAATIRLELFQRQLEGEQHDQVRLIVDSLHQGVDGLREIMTELGPESDSPNP